MISTQQKISMQKSFWDLADNTKLSEQYRIDKNLQYLQIAPLSILKKIFIQYRYFTHFYITDLSILISKLPFGNLKSILAEILHEELGNGHAEKAHPTLYDEFLQSIGISTIEMQKAEVKCIDNLQQIQNALINKSWAYGIGLRGMGGECLCQVYLSTMHEYFSKNIEILKLKDQIAWEFWNIHIGEVDLHHQIIVRTAINDLLNEQPDIISDLVNGYLESKDAWDRYWGHIFFSAKS
jgi:hypothetical protein